MLIDFITNSRNYSTCHKHSLPPNDLSVTSLFGLGI